MELKALPITHQAVVPDSYQDIMGHMNVMWYTYLFGRATEGLFKLCGLDLDHFAAHDSGIFALAQFFRYLSEVRAGDRLTLRSRLLGRSAKKMHVMSFMIKDDGEVLAATVEFLNAHVNMKTRRTAPFPDSIAEKIDQLVAEHAALRWDAPVSGTMRP